MGLAILARLTSIDPAIRWSVLARAWQAVAGPLTLLLIARNFSQELQGYYYTFASLLALQSFAELGFYLVIINLASHEWAHLGLDAHGRIVGSSDALSRLVSLGRLIVRWYTIVSGVFVVLAIAVGLMVLSRESHPDVEWRAPWLVLVFLTGLLLWIMPFGSLLEGCNQMAAVNKLRAIRAVLETSVIWISILSGAGLWVAVASAVVRLSC